MTSALKRVSNRRNANKSTGPKSEAGKARSALNALRHGLSVQPTFDAATQEKIDELAGAFTVGGKCNSLIKALAREAAEAQVMVMRVKEARHLAWEDAKRDRSITNRGELIGLNDPVTARYLLEQRGIPASGLKKGLPHLFEAPFETDIERDMAVLKLASKKLSGLIRYERRAANRRDKALRELEQARADL